MTVDADRSVRAGSRLLISDCDLLARPGQFSAGVDIEIDGDRIRRISPAGENEPQVGTEVIDGRGLLAMPGLVNAHTHSPENCLRGVGEGLMLEPWLFRMFGSSGLFDAEDHYVNALAGAVEMLKLGITTVVDHLWMTPPSRDAVGGAVRAYEEAGIRAGVAPLMNDCDFTGELAAAKGFDLGAAALSEQVKFFPTDELLGIFEDVVSAWHGSANGRIRILAGPGGVQWCTDALLGGLADAARSHQTGFHVHLMETSLQRSVCEERFGRSGVEALEDLGVLGPNCSLPHSVWIDEEDVRRIARTGSIVVHNPAANLRLGSGRCPVGFLLQEGARVAIGTDGAASSDNQNVWEMVKLAALIHNDGPRWVSGEDALQMATSAGSAVLAAPGSGGPTPGGEVVEGGVADLILLDQNDDGLVGVQVLEPGLALSESGRSVRHAIVDGQVVLRDGELETVDEQAIRAALRDQVERRRSSVKSPPAMTEEAMARITLFRASI